jgi:single-stranded DNA-binding protein
MANITVKSAFVEDVIGSPVFALKLAEPHSKKDDAGKWQTVSRTFFDLKVGRESGIDLGRFSKGDRVSFTGTQKTETREHQGKKFYTLTVWADTVDLAQQGTPTPAANPAVDDYYAQKPAPAFVDDSAPF